MLAMMKLCKVFGETKTARAFWKDSKEPDGYRPICRKCENRLEIETRGERRCYICGEVKPLDKFYRTGGEYFMYCKDCAHDIRKLYDNKGRHVMSVRTKAINTLGTNELRAMVLKQFNAEVKLCQ